MLILDAIAVNKIDHALTSVHFKTEYIKTRQQILWVLCSNFCYEWGNSRESAKALFNQYEQFIHHMCPKLN